MPGQSKLTAPPAACEPKASRLKSKVVLELESALHQGAIYGHTGIRSRAPLRRPKRYGFGDAYPATGRTNMGKKPKRFATRLPK